ncbi:MAG: class I SAM-dependent methyltransferase [Nocardioides sp.]|nr:class I SAM-dependent methyltransferase [Nocardioides sp.]
MPEIEDALLGVLGTALALAFADDEFDAGWSMGTLMRLPGDGMATALSERGRLELSSSWGSPKSVPASPAMPSRPPK